MAVIVEKKRVEERTVFKGKNIFTLLLFISMFTLIGCSKKSNMEVVKETKLPFTKSKTYGDFIEILSMPEIKNDDNTNRIYIKSTQKYIQNGIKHSVLISMDIHVIDEKIDNVRLTFDVKYNTEIEHIKSIYKDSKWTMTYYHENFMHPSRQIEEENVPADKIGYMMKKLYSTIFGDLEGIEDSQAFSVVKYNEETYSWEIKNKEGINKAITEKLKFKNYVEQDYGCISKFYIGEYLTSFYGCPKDINTFKDGKGKMFTVTYTINYTEGFVSFNLTSAKK